MNLKDALLCIDCDEVFTPEGSTCNSRCPLCGSSVFAPLAGWVPTWTAFEKSGETDRVTPCGTSTKERVMEVIRPTSIAA